MRRGCSRPCPGIGRRFTVDTFVYFALNGTDVFEGQYFAEAPERTGRYQFGPIEVTREADGAALGDREYEADDTTETVTVAGADTST